MGQELTARTKYRGLIKKRLVPVIVDGTMPDTGTPIMLEGREVGDVRSGRAGWALALIRIEHLNNSTSSFTAGEAKISPYKPDWAEF